MSLEVPAFSALLEAANGMEAQPARVDAAVINNVPPRIQADFAFSAGVGIPNPSSLPTLASLYAIVLMMQLDLPEIANGTAGQGSTGQRHQHGAEDLRDGDDVHVLRQQEACRDRGHAHG
jgi:hypothetical protein